MLKRSTNRVICVLFISTIDKGTATPTNCPQGTFNNNTGLKAQNECKQCAPGMYCLSDGLTYPTGECDERYFCGLGARYAKPLDTLTGGNCTKGHYCPVGTYKPVPCPVRILFF